ncbi:hypothetical protein PG989_016287 [Apiospora arundinis]
MSSPTKSLSGYWEGNIYDLQAIGQGGTAIVFSIDDYRAIKVPISSPFGLQAIEQEREIYRLFERKRSEHVIACLNPEHKSGVLLEKCVGSVRGRLRQMQRGDAGCDAINSKQALALARRWAYEAAQGLAYIHRQGVIQADVGCHNMLLDREGILKLADFSGSGIENTQYRALVIYDPRSRLSNLDQPDKASDLFALGSAMYEMATGHLPYPRLSTKQVQQRLFGKQFPDLEELRGKAPEIAEAIRGCWNVKRPGGFTSADEVVRVLGLRYNNFPQYRVDTSRPQKKDVAKEWFLLFRVFYI